MDPSERTLTDLWIYSDTKPRAIAQSLKQKGVTVTPYHDPLYGDCHVFARVMPGPKWEDDFIDGKIVKPHGIDIPYYQHFLEGKTYGLKEFNTKIKIPGGIVNQPDVAIPTLKPVFEILKQDKINFITRVVGIPNIAGLVGYYLEGKTFTDPTDKNGLVGLMQ